ncbi:TRAP transporter large permease [Deltaproteobacteria bacterium]|nr:TRAP transporter large permease [Deltaproteobacteria bacterium]
MGYEQFVGLCVFFVMLALIVLGIPIFAAMLACSFIGFCLIDGTATALIQFTNAPYNIIADYSFAVIPLFILMGEFAGAGGIADGAYNAFTKWFTKLRGGILMATVAGNAVFGACSGVPFAGMVVFTKIAMPQIEKYGYDKSQSLACISTAGILATLIPPSVPVIIVCILINLSIGRTLVAGIIPGILCAIVLLITIWIVGLISPQKMPVISDEKATWREKFSSLTLLWPMLGLFLLIIGGIYAGVFPPTVGGAIGAAGTLIYAIARGTDKRKIGRCFWDMVIVNAQIFVIIMAGYIFARFIALSGISDYFNKMIIAMEIPPLAVMAIVLFFYILMGCVGELMAVLIITLPIVFPLLTGLGFDPYAFAIILIFMQGIGGITPPIGMNVFIVASLARVDAMDVFRGIIPYFLAQLALVWIIILFPEIVTWLPNIFFR